MQHAQQLFHGLDADVSGLDANIMVSGRLANDKNISLKHLSTLLVRLRSHRRHAASSCVCALVRMCAFSGAPAVLCMLKHRERESCTALHM